MKKLLSLLPVFYLLLHTEGYAATLPATEKVLFVSTTEIPAKQPSALHKNSFLQKGLLRIKLKERIIKSLYLKALNKRWNASAPAESGERNIAGIVSLISSIIGAALIFLFTPLGLLFTVAGIAVGIIGLKHKKKTAAVIGLIIAGATLILLLVAFISFLTLGF